MAEYINKAETLEKIVRFSTKEGSNTVCSKLYADIFNMPTIDIVTCGECRQWKRIEDTKYGFCHNCQHGYLSNRWDISIDRKTKEDHFCADGKRSN